MATARSRLENAFVVAESSSKSAGGSSSSPNISTSSELKKQHFIISVWIGEGRPTEFMVAVPSAHFSCKKEFEDLPFRNRLGLWRCYSNRRVRIHTKKTELSKKERKFNAGGDYLD